MIYLFYRKGYAAVTGPMSQLNEWKAHASFHQPLTYLWHIYSIAMGMQQQLSTGTSWMNGRPTHLLLMFDQPLWFLWYIDNFMSLCDHIPFFIVFDQFDEVFTAWSMQKMRLRMIFTLYWVLAEWSLAYTAYKRNDLYLTLSISGMLFTLYWVISRMIITLHWV